MKRHQPVRLAATLAAIALVVAVAPAAAAEPTPPPAEPVPGATDLLPSAHHLDARAHADDAIEFEPGGRVTVPFRPRADDPWTVGGVAPRQLPAGRVSGADMAVSPQGSRWAVAGAGGGVESVGGADPIHRNTTSDVAGDTTGSIATGLFREVFGFLPYWELSDPALDLDYSVLSTIAYFSVGVDTAGNLRKRNSDGTTTTGWAGWTSSRMTQVMTDAHRSGARVVLTITAFAWTTSEANAQAALLGNPTARLNLARQAAAAVRDRGADGINLDFEPIASGYADEFTALVRSVRSELDAIAPGYQLTFDTTGFIGNYPIEAATAPGGADAIFIMGYDFRTGGSATSGSIAALQGPSFDIGDAVAQYTARVPASKLILGVPYYGRVWSTASDQPRSTNTSGARTGASGTAIYTTARAQAAQHGRRWDSVEASPWTAYQREHCTTTYGCVTSWRQLWYDDAQSLGLKYDLVNDRGLRGAGIWALGYDNGRAELDEALASRFLNDVRGPVAGINFMPWRQRDAGFVVAWSGRDASGIASWDVQVSVNGGAWTSWLTGTTTTSAVYLGRHGQGLAFRVRGQDGKGNVGAWDVTDTWRATPTMAVGGFAGVRTDGLQMRSGPSTTAATVGQLRVGQIISLVGGPVSAGGQTWWEAVGPLRQWRPVGAVSRFWVAQGPSSGPYLVASRSPNSTVVDAVIRDLDVAANGTADAGAASARVVSPNGDGVADTIAVTWTNAVPVSALELRVVRADGTVAGSIPLGSAASTAGVKRVEWNGRIGSTALPDDTYVLALAGTADGVAVSAPSSRPATAEQMARFGVRVDTTAPVLDRSASTSAVLSPNGDGRLDDVGVSVRASEPATWAATVTGVEGPRAGLLVRSASPPEGAWTWDGRDQIGDVVPDGRYRVALLATDAAGNRSVRTWSFLVDTAAPAVTTSLSTGLISPNGDGTLETTTLAWSVGETATTRLELRRESATVAEWPAAATGTFTWGGFDVAGRPVPDGPYELRLSAADAAGNVAPVDRPVTVDRTLSRVAWAPALFFPHDGDPLARSASASFELTGPARTTVRILTRDNRYVRTAWAGRDLGAGVHRWAWDGKAGTGHLVPRGWYRVVVTAESAVATTTLTRLVLVNAFTATPSTTTPAAGETLTLELRTAEPLAGVPSVTFRQTGHAPVTKAAVQVGSGRYRVDFLVPAGAGPASLSVTARDARGGANSQTLAITVR